MRQTVFIVLLGLLGTTAARADVKVAMHGTHMDIVATKATVSDILDTVAQKTGMKVIFNGPRPPREITKSIVDRSPADALLGILEGEGLNFAVILNPAGTQVETLLVTGPAPVRPAPATAASGASTEGMPPQPDWSVDADIPPPPPPPPGAATEDSAPPPPPPSAGGENAAIPKETPVPATLPTPTPYPSSSFTPQGPGPIILPIPGSTPVPYH
jgi:hypothetical protein